MTIDQNTITLQVNLPARADNGSLKAHSAAEAKSHETPNSNCFHEHTTGNPKEFGNSVIYGDPRDCHGRNGMYAIIAAGSLWNAERNTTKHSETT